MKIKNMSSEQIKEEKSKLKTQELELIKREKELESKALFEKIENNKLSMDYIRKNQDIILPLLKHSYVSCDDYNLSNGFYEGRARCNKCGLMELLEEYNNEYEIDFEICISKLR